MNIFEEALDLFEEASFDAYLTIRDRGFRSDEAIAAREKKARKRQALLDYVDGIEEAVRAHAGRPA